jgi:hypothetical protein
MKSIPVVAINGGLGNQLFQWCYAHTLREDRRFKIHKNFESNDFSGQLHFQLRSLELKCHHIYEENQNPVTRALHRSIFKLMNSLWHYPLFRKVAHYLGYLRESPKKDDLQNAGRFSNHATRYAYGYFQSVDTVLKSAILEDEIDTLIAPLAEIVLKSLRLENNSYDVVHVRKYPIQNMRKVDIGNLSVEYYRGWIGKMDTTNLIALCKELREVESLLKIYPNVTVLDKNSLDPWESLALMSKASKCLSSNSTLSWWGALLCYRNGGDVHLPSQWSYWNNVNAFKLHFDGCKIQESIWDTSAWFDSTCVNPKTGKIS